MTENMQSIQRPSVKQAKGSRLKAGVMALIAVILVSAVGIGGVAAFLHAKADAVTNGFVAASTPTITVVEEFDGTVKSNVGVKVTGDAAVLVRAAIVITLTDDNGNTLPQAAVLGTDYSISYGTGWTQGPDGFWYCNKPITNGTTANLIDTATALSTCTGHLTIDILAQVVQAAPSSAVQNAWGMSYNNGNWSVA